MIAKWFSWRQNWLEPTSLAKEKLQIESDWFFQIHELNLTISFNSLDSISKPISILVQKYATKGFVSDEHMDALLDLIIMVKEHDDGSINWKNTNYLVEDVKLYSEFLKTTIAQTINTKYYGNSVLIEDKIRKECDAEKFKVFDKWGKGRRKIEL